MCWRWSAAHNALSGNCHTHVNRAAQRKAAAMHRIARFATTVAVTRAPVQQTVPAHTGCGHREPHRFALDDRSALYVQKCCDFSVSWDR